MSPAVTDEPGTEIALRPQNQLYVPRLQLSVDEAIELIAAKQEFMQRALQEGVHYGVIPGAKKPSLWKAGAELLLSSMGMIPESENDAPPVLDMTGADHNGEPFIKYDRRVTVYRYDRESGEKRIVATGSGSCNSWETKYRYRQGDRICPECGKSGTVIKGKADFGGGWLCFAKKGGCNNKWPDGAAVIEGQNTEKVANPDVADQINTILKMADKRALVDATLRATGWSDVFTQDLEDFSKRRPAEISADDAVEADYQEVPDANTPGASNGEAEHGSGPGVFESSVDKMVADRNPGVQTMAVPSAIPATAPQDKVDILIKLTKDLPAKAMWNPVKVKALLGKPGETPDTVLDGLIVAHEFHCGPTCVHAQAAMAVWK